MQVREEVTTFLKVLRETIIDAFGTLETSHQFERKSWDYESGQGGGEIGIIRGKHFEKGAVNFSSIEGSTFPGNDATGPFFATGISLITHMHNPFAPTVHFNIRYIESDNKTWFGGGYDLTPMGFPNDEDTQHFHSIAKKTLEPHGKELYPLFSKQAKEYFFIKHRNKERGVGGIFFDHFNTGNFKSDYTMWQDVGTSFTETIMPIYQRRIYTPFSEEDKEHQLALRAHYVEFNLLYDRGTKFGFLSGGNPEAILCSMPPLAKWW